MSEDYVGWVETALRELESNLGETIPSGDRAFLAEGLEFAGRNLSPGGRGILAKAAMGEVARRRAAGEPWPNRG